MIIIVSGVTIDELWGDLISTGFHDFFFSLSLLKFSNKNENMVKRPKASQIAVGCCSEFITIT